MKKAFIVLVFALIGSLLFFSCPSDDDNKGNGDGNGIDYANYTSNSFITIQNNTDKDLVVFKNTPSVSSLIGGVPARSGMHGLKKDAVLFASDGDFILFLVTEKDYLANKNNLSALAGKPFVSFFVFYSANAGTNTVYTVSSILSGEYTLEVRSPLNWNVELRLGGVNGPTLGYIPKGQRSTIFKVDAGVFEIFPVLRQYNAFRDVISTYYPQWESGPMAGRAMSVGISISAAEPYSVVYLNDLLGGINLNLSTGCAFLLVENQCLYTVQVFNGNTLQLTSTGITSVPPGTTQMFTVYMPMFSNGEYANNTSVNSYKIGSSLITAGIGDVVLEVDKIYRVVVTGNDNEITVSAPVYESDMSFDMAY